MKACGRFCALKSWGSESPNGVTPVEEPIKGIPGPAELPYLRWAGNPLMTWSQAILAPDTVHTQIPLITGYYCDD